MTVKNSWIIAIAILEAIALIFIHRQPLATVACASKYAFINPEPGCEETEKEQLQRLKDAQSAVQQHIDEIKFSGRAADVSVFVRDLTTRRWFGIDENANFSPGSLLKLPLLVTYYKVAELRPEILDEQIYFPKSSAVSSLDNVQDIVSAPPLSAGQSYSVNQLLEKMIIDSDNDATKLLFDRVDKMALGKVFVDLGVYIPTSGGVDQNFVSVSTYADIIRALYNAAYLSRQMSNQALDILSRSNFKDGLAAGVPAGVAVAHKFGEHIFTDEKGRILRAELHDCGIIYEPEHPYIECVMTRGANLKTLAAAIKEISSSTYSLMGSD